MELLFFVQITVE